MEAVRGCVWIFSGIAQSLILNRSRLHDGWGDPSHVYTSPIWGPPPPCKKAFMHVET